MSTVPPEIIRSAAQRLAILDPSLPANVEARLQQGAKTEPPAQYEPASIAIASLLVSVASLAWTIYSDLKNAAKSPAADSLERRVRVETEKLTPLGITDEQRNIMIKTVLEETTRYVENKA
jgi:hypothetical protein